MSIFGWCTGPEGSKGDHESCRREIGGSNGISVCGCPCHGDKSAGQGAESGTLGAQVNEPPAAYLAVRDRGFSPTLEVD